MLWLGYAYYFLNTVFSNDPLQISLTLCAKTCEKAKQSKPVRSSRLFGMWEPLEKNKRVPGDGFKFA